MCTIEFQADFRQLHLGAGGFHGRGFARCHATVGNHQSALGQGQRTLGQVEALLGATGHINARAAFAAQFQGLAQFDAGGARVAAGVFGIHGQHRVGDQPGLLAAALGDVDFPLRSGQLGVVDEGALQR